MLTDLSEVVDIDCNISSVEQLVESYRKCGGYVAKSIADAAEILLEMLSDPDVTIFMSFTANLVATGLRGLIADFIRRGFVDIVITTAGTLDHDIARARGGKYLVYTFDADDVELREKGYNRIGNIIVHTEHYGVPVERVVFEVLSELINRHVYIVSVRELIWHVGSKLEDKSSIIRAAYEAKVPIYVPGFVDGAFGTAILMFNEIQRARGGKEIFIDVLRDERELMNIVYDSKKIGGIVIGGGISKHHLIWWAQFREGLDYAVYITTAVEWDGSLSGARPREAISWRKIKPTARTTFVYADATVVLPILFSYVARRLKSRPRRPLKCL